MNELWPEGFYFRDWRYPAVYVTGVITAMVRQVVADNGQSVIDAIFAGKKAVGAVLCVAFAPTVAAHPNTGKPTFMPLKVPVVVELSSSAGIPPDFIQEMQTVNDGMQTFLG